MLHRRPPMCSTNHSRRCTWRAAIGTLAIVAACSSDRVDKTTSSAGGNPRADSGSTKGTTGTTDSAAGNARGSRGSAPATSPVAATKPGSSAPSATATTGPAKPFGGPEVVRGLYVNRFAAQSSKRMKWLIGVADSTEINALVIDMKDEFGLNFKPSNPEFQKQMGNHGVVPNLKAMLDTLKAHDILAIARIVVFKDSVTARVHPEWTIRKADGSAWRDKEGLAWVNPYHHELWEYNIGLAEELVKLGFGEIQFDYIRFPEPYKSLPAQVFPGANGVAKPDALKDYLALAKSRLNALGVRSTADIFGLVTTVHGALEVGQWWEKVSPALDVVLPMTYPSHYPSGAYGIARPNAKPYEILKIAIDSARVRDAKLGITTPEHVRPWLQAFTLGKPDYGPEQITAQKQGVYDAGYDGWVLWHPGSKYEVFLPALEKELVSRKKK